MIPLRPGSRAAVALLFCGLLCACGESETELPKKPVAQELMERDKALLKDIGLAGRELERRLLERITVRDGIAIVRDPDLGYIFSYYLPATTPWVLSCGITGMSIALGTSVSGDGNSVGNEVEVRLAFAPLDDKACSVLGPQLAKRLQVLLEPQKSG